jgi:hypothetical protein
MNGARISQLVLPPFGRPKNTMAMPLRNSSGPIAYGIDYRLLLIGSARDHAERDDDYNSRR